MGSVASVATGGLTGLMGLGTGLAAGASGGAGVHAANRAGSEASRGFVEAQRLAREAAEEARGDINRLFPEAITRGQQGFQGALDVFGQTIPGQAGVFQQGNVGAQQQILAGLPQIQNALLGGQVDFSGLQPTQLDMPSFDFARQETPMAREERDRRERLDRFTEALRIGRENAEQQGQQDLTLQGQHQSALDTANFFRDIAQQTAADNRPGVPTIFGQSLSSLLTGRFK